MTFGLSKYDGDMLADYRDNTGTQGLAAALSGSFSASPSFEMSAADDPAISSVYAGTGLSRARNLDVGALSYDQALNYAPKDGAPIPLKDVLGEFTSETAFSTLYLALAGAYGYKRGGYWGAVVGALAALGMKNAISSFNNTK